MKPDFKAMPTKPPEQITEREILLVIADTVAVEQHKFYNNMLFDLTVQLKANAAKQDDSSNIVERAQLIIGKIAKVLNSAEFEALVAVFKKYL